MFPDNKISSIQVVGNVLYPEVENRDKIFDTEIGGIDIRNVNKGLNFKGWKFWIDFNTNIYCAPIGDSASRTLLYTGTNLSELSGTFDRNMNTVITFKEGSTFKIRRYEVTTNSYTIQPLHEYRSVVLTHDDKRDFASEYADVIMSFIKENQLYYSLQRDRFLIERHIPTKDLDRMEILSFSMSDKKRLQWKLGKRDVTVPMPDWLQ